MTKIGDFDFVQHLKDLLDGYEGDNKSLIKYASPIFALCANMLGSEKIGRKEKNV